MSSITSANAVLTLAVTNVFNVPVRINDFSTDDIFDADPLTVGETMMGVDGILTAGYVFNEQKMKISLMADSLSNNFFETWWLSEKNNIEKYYATGTIRLKSISRSFNLVKGALTVYPVMPVAKKVLQPKVYEITWQEIQPAPI